VPDKRIDREDDIFVECSKAWASSVISMDGKDGNKGHLRTPGYYNVCVEMK